MDTSGLGMVLYLVIIVRSFKGVDREECPKTGTGRTGWETTGWDTQDAGHQDSWTGVTQRVRPVEWVSVRSVHDQFLTRNWRNRTEPSHPVWMVSEKALHPLTNVTPPTPSVWSYDSTPRYSV